MFTKWPNQTELSLTIGGKDVRESNRFKTTKKHWNNGSY